MGLTLFLQWGLRSSFYSPSFYFSGKKTVIDVKKNSRKKIHKRGERQTKSTGWGADPINERGGRGVFRKG